MNTWERKIADGAVVYHYPIIEFLPDDYPITEMLEGNFNFTMTYDPEIIKHIFKILDDTGDTDAK